MAIGNVIDLAQKNSVLDRPRLESLYDRAVECMAVPGDFVECGCGGGGSAGVLAAAITDHAAKKFLWVYDTFDGLPPADLAVDRHPPWDDDVIKSCTGSSKGTQDTVRDVCRQLGPRTTVLTTKGLYAQTLPMWNYGKIALLHADADWWYSTEAILRWLWPHVSPGGVVVFDDYHFWTGCSKAVDEFFAGRTDKPAWTTVSCAVWGRKPG